MRKYIVASATNAPMMGRTEFGLVEADEAGEVLTYETEVVPRRISNLPTPQKYRHIKGYDDNTGHPIYPTEKAECITFFPDTNSNMTKRRAEISLIDQTPRPWEEAWERVREIRTKG